MIYFCISHDLLSITVYSVHWYTFIREVCGNFIHIISILINVIIYKVYSFHVRFTTKHTRARNVSNAICVRTLRSRPATSSRTCSYTPIRNRTSVISAISRSDRNNCWNVTRTCTTIQRTCRHHRERRHTSAPSVDVHSGTKVTSSDTWPCTIQTLVYNRNN